MRISAFLLSFLLCTFATVRSQMPDPGAQQDAEAAREKLLKASDELDNIQANSEATKMSVDGMRADITKLQTDLAQAQADNAALRQQVSDLQSSLEQFKADQARSRQVLIDNVAGMIAAAKSAPAAKPEHRHQEESPTPEATSPPRPSVADSLAPPPDPGSPAASSAAPNSSDADPSAPVKRKGYYHVVASGETLKLICEAYRDEGIDVSLSAVRKANGLTDTSVLKVGQKLFIPKPGT